MTPRKIILCEDKYGEPFFKELMNRLKSEGFVSRRLGVDVAKFYGACNVKLERQMKVISTRKVRSFIIMVDGDGQNPEAIKNRVNIHVPSDLMNITFLIVLDYEIEDWICAGLGLQIDDKSSVVLKHKLGYEKHHLKSYVQKLDIRRLMKCTSFSFFIDCIKQ